MKSELEYYIIIIINTGIETKEVYLKKKKLAKVKGNMLSSEMKIKSSTYYKS